MRSTPIAALALALAAVCAVACDDATLQEPRAAAPKDHSNPFGWVLGPDCIDCTREYVGPPFLDDPSWGPGRVVLFSAGVGSSPEARRSWIQSLLAPHHKFYAAENDFGPAQAHPPPYDDEIYERLDARGLTASQAFDDVQFTAPQAVMMVMTLVPWGVTPFEGISFDFEQGPVIPNFLFPITVDAELYRDGRLVSSEHSVHIGHDQFDPPLTVSGTMKPLPSAQGVSHMLLALAADGSLGGSPPFGAPDGDYVYRVTMRDARVIGWNVSVPFRVGKGGNGNLPPPATGTGGSSGPGSGGGPGTGSGGRATGSAGAGGSAAGGGPGARVGLVPDPNGAFDGSNAAGVRGAWWAGGDFYGVDGSAGGGSCSLAGFPPGNCSMISSPPLDQPFAPDVKGAMCTAGVVAQVVTGSDGQTAWSAIWGTIVGFNLAVDDAGVVGPYDAIAHKLTGFAFDLDGAGPPGGPWMRVEFATVGTNNGAAYWQGAVSDTSPVQRSGHYEMRWGEVGGPMYLGPSASPFDPTQLTSIRFHVVPNTSGPIPYGFCIRNTAFLTD